MLFIITSGYHAGAQETAITEHSIWAHNAHVVMENVSHLKLITMSLLQTCSYITGQMQTDIEININKFLQAFSIKTDSSCLHPPS